MISPAARRAPLLIEQYDITHPRVAPSLQGLRILHISDIHLTGPWNSSTILNSLLESLPSIAPDLLALTGDYIERRGTEPHAIDLLTHIAARLTPRLGTFGIFGNHDTPQLIHHARSIPNITWLNNHAISIAPDLTILGTSEPEDLLAATTDSGSTTSSHPPSAQNETGGTTSRRPSQNETGGTTYSRPSQNETGGTTSSRPSQSETGGTTYSRPSQNETGGAASSRPSPFRLLLAHDPTNIIPAAAFNIDLVLAGHTHGGQIRISPRLCPHTSCDLPPSAATGLIRYRSTLCCISRGLGQTVLPFRFRCPPHISIYTLKNGPLPAPHAPGIEQLIPW